MIMKKLATILITVTMVVGLATSVFAFGTGSEQRGYVRGGHGNQRVYEPGRRVYYQTYNRYAHTHQPGVVVSLPLVPLPGVSHMFPIINIRIR
jgi:hypothetical protein